MNEPKRHVGDLLSPFLDGQLPEADRRMVEAHVEKCEECGRGLTELKSLSSLLAATPRAPLPTGFRERLERRRAREAVEQDERSPFLLPMPAKALAFSACAFTVCLVGYNAWRGPGSVEDRVRELAPLSATAGAKIVGAARLGTAADVAPSAAGKKEAHAPGAPIGVDDSLSREEAEATRRAKDDFSNEKLQSHLERERRKMGIQGIVPPSAPPEPGENAAAAEPMAGSEAREYMRAMAESFQRQRMTMEGYREPISLDGRAKPKLLKSRSSVAAGGSPLVDAAPAKTGFVGGVRGLSAAASSKGDLQAAAGMAQAPVTVLPYRSAKMKAVAANAAAPPPAPAQAEAPAPATEAKSLEPAGGPSVRAARSAEELKALWQTLKDPGERPAVNFSTEMVVAVSASGPVEIVRVWTSGRRVVVEYRIPPEGSGPASAFRVVPKSDLPISPQLVR